MRVFVTGASGHIGSAVVPELLEAGHQVVGLARSETLRRRARGRRRRGASRRPGRPRRPQGGRGRGRRCHPPGLQARGDALRRLRRRGRRRPARDRGLGAALEGSGQAVREHLGHAHADLWRHHGPRGHRAATSLPAGPRIDAENTVVALAERGVRSAVVRLPPLVHSTLDHHGFGPTPDRHRPRQGRLGLRRRRVQPLAGRPHARRGAPLPAGARERPGRIAAARGR